MSFKKCILLLMNSMLCLILSAIQYILHIIHNSIVWQRTSTTQLCFTYIIMHICGQICWEITISKLTQCHLVFWYFGTKLTLSVFVLFVSDTHTPDLASRVPLNHSFLSHSTFHKSNNYKTLYEFFICAQKYHSDLERTLF